MKTIYAVLGKKCGHSHFFEIEADAVKSFYQLRSGGQPVIRFREVDLKEAGGHRIDTIILDELSEPQEKGKK